MAAKVSLALNAIYDILIMDAEGQRLALESFKNLDAARRRLPVLAANIPARKSLHGIATGAPSWPKPTVIRPTAPHGCCRFVGLACGSSCCSSVLPSRRSLSNDTCFDSLGAALFGPTGRVLQLCTFYLQWSPVFRFELLNLSISSPMNSGAVAFHQM